MHLCVRIAQIVRATAVALACLPAVAVSQTVSPVVLEFDSHRRVVTVSVTNPGYLPMNVQTTTLSWSQVDGRDQTSATTDLLVVPALATVQPGTSQLIRVALRRPQPATVERTYRLVLEDTTPAAPAAESGVQLRFAHDMPVLVAPHGTPTQRLRWTGCNSPADPGFACVHLTNTGNRRTQIAHIALLGAGGEQALALPTPRNLLAGASRKWQIPLAGAAMVTWDRVQVRNSSGAVLGVEANPGTPE